MNQVNGPTDSFLETNEKNQYSKFDRRLHRGELETVPIHSHQEGYRY